MSVTESFDLLWRHTDESQSFLKLRIRLTPGRHIDISAILVSFRFSVQSISSRVISLEIEVEDEGQDDGHGGESQSDSVSSKVSGFVDCEVNERRDNSSRVSCRMKAPSQSQRSFDKSDASRLPRVNIMPDPSARLYEGPLRTNTHGSV